MDLYRRWRDKGNFVLRIRLLALQTDTTNNRMQFRSGYLELSNTKSNF